MGRTALGGTAQDLEQPPLDVRASVAAEVAVCRSAVGVADRSDLGVFELRGRPTAVQAALRQATGRRLTVGLAVRTEMGWWCLLAPYRALVLGAPQTRVPLRALLRRVTREAPDTTTADVSADYAVLALVGPRAAALAPRAVAPVALLREADERFLVVVRRAEVDTIRSEMLAAGRAHGALTVGREAVELLRVAERARDCQRTAAAL